MLLGEYSKLMFSWNPNSGAPNVEVVEVDQQWERGHAADDMGV